jgi:hypothetical protein
VTTAISLAKFMFMKKGQWVAGVVGKGRFSLIDFVFFPNLKNGFEVAILGLKGGESWRRFRQENFNNTNFSITCGSPTSEDGKAKRLRFCLIEGRLSLWFFFDSRFFGRR